MIKLALIRYDTGWDYRISSSIREPVTDIEAHAPSTVVLRCHDEGRICIRPMVKPLGNSKAKPVVVKNGCMNDDVMMWQNVHVDLSSGDVLELRFDLVDDDKGGCWNYWGIADAEVYVSAIYADTHSRLGDSISVLSGITGLCGEKPAVCRLPLYRELLECFDFGDVRYVEDEPDALCVDNIFASCSWHQFWLERFGEALASAFNREFKCRGAPECRLGSWKPGDSTCFQFDSRSAQNMDAEMCREIMRGVAGNSAVVLGGMNSERYLGEEDGFRYSFGDLRHEIRELLGCREFIGVDSGIAHLSGMLGVKSTVINLIEQDTVIRLFGKYRNMRFADKEMLERLITHG